jgi:hypothetical protein
MGEVKENERGRRMTIAADIAKKLKKFMADNNYSVSDIYRGLIPVINPEKSKGNGRPEGRSRVLGALRKPAPQRSVDSGFESCST